MDHLNNEFEGNCQTEAVCETSKRPKHSMSGWRFAHTCASVMLVMMVSIIVFLHALGKTVSDAGWTLLAVCAVFTVFTAIVQAAEALVCDTR